ncbi:MAG TPA: aspartyl protease family protein, partial [Lysobacter sp.]
MLIALLPLAAVAGVQPLVRTANGHPATLVTLAGHGRFLFVVDTGASASAVHEHTRARLGLVPEPGAPIEMHGAAGSQRIHRYRLPRLTLAGVAADRLLVSGLPEGVRHGEDVMGVLGRDVFGTRLVEFDLPGGRLGLHRAGAVPASARGWHVVPVRLMPGTGLVVLEVSLEGRPVTAVLDTGARQTFVNWHAARAAGIEPGAPGLVR